MGAGNRTHRRDRRHRHLQGDRQDRGNVVAYEVLLFIALLAIPLVLLADMAPGGQGSIVVREDVGQAVDDWLIHVNTAPDPTGAQATLLDRMVAEGVQGNETGIVARLQRILPRVTAYNVFLDNGVGRMVLRDDGTPPGEAASAVQPWSPAWGPLLAAPGQSLVDGATGGLPVTVVPVHRARGLQDTPGLKVEVELTLPEPDAGSINLTAFRPLTNRTAEGPSAALSLLDFTGNPVFVVAPPDGNETLYFRVQESSGRALAAGTELELRLPPGFGGVLARSDYNPGWTDLTLEGNTTYGFVARAKLGSALAGAATQFMLNATVVQDAGHFHVVEATLGGGEYGRLQALFVDDANATDSLALPPGRGPFLSVPGLAPWSSEALVGVAVANPETIARTLTITRVTLTAHGEASIGTFTGVEPASGWASVTNGAQWTGSIALDADEVQDFRVRVKAHAPPDAPGMLVSGLRLDARNGYTTWVAQQPAPGHVALWLAPRAGGLQGYPETAGAHDLWLNATHRGTAMKGNATATTVATNVVQATAGDTARGRLESWFALDAAQAPLGGTIAARWDLDRLREELVGGPASTFKCYTSTAGAWAWRTDRADCLANGGLDWQFLDEAPRVNLTIHPPAPAGAGTVGAGGATLTTLGVAGTATAAVPSDAMLGTHVVELSADFTLRGPASEAVQTVRFLQSFDVHRPGGDVVERPLYDVVVQAWLQDWV